MKVGDYVRTKYGSIRKIINLETYCNLIIETDKGDLLKDNIVKASSNIIDLIEVGDYVNGECVINVDSIEAYTKDGMYLNEDIKSIVTKEQFSQMEYRIGE